MRKEIDIQNEDFIFNFEKEEEEDEIPIIDPFFMDNLPTEIIHVICRICRKCITCEKCKCKKAEN